MFLLAAQEFGWGSLTAFTAKLHAAMNHSFSFVSAFVGNVRYLSACLFQTLLISCILLFPGEVTSQK